jgi:aminoglycoside 6'-N-acetyltransferase I
MESRENTFDELTIRPVVRADAAEWLRLRTLLWPDGANDHEQKIEAFFAGKLDEPDAVFIAQNSDSRVLALLELAVRSELLEMKSERIGYVEGLFVEPEARRGNVARRLLEFSREWARERRCTVFASDRAERVIVYQRFGVESLGIRYQVSEDEDRTAGSYLTPET